MGTFSIFKLGGSNSSIADINCYDTNVKVDIYDEVTSTVNKNSSCDGNSTPAIIEIFDGNCESGGFRYLISEHECATAVGEQIKTVASQSMPNGCFYNTNDGKYYYNSATHSNESIGGSYQKGVCKQ